MERSGAPYIGAFVLLMPKDSSQIWAYRRDQTDSDGSFRLATIPAGDYFLIAVTDGNDLVYRHPKGAQVLIAAAKAIHMDAGEHQEMKLDVVNTGTLDLPLQ